MQLPKKLTGLLIITLLASSGCGDAASVTDARDSADTAPAFDGIGWAGSGNRSDSTGTPTATSTGTASTGSGHSDTGSTTTTTQGIGFAGSGN